MRSAKNNKTLKPLYKNNRKRKTSASSANAVRRHRRRRFWLYPIIVLLLGVGVLTAVRWNAWFGNIPEPPYATPDTIDRVCLTSGAHFMTERVVSWRCDTVQQLSWLEYKRIDSVAGADTAVVALPTRYHRVQTRGGMAYYYWGQINGLKPGARYAYRALTGEKKSPWYDFSMPPDNQREQFLYIGDIQDPSGPISDSLFRVLRQHYTRPDFIAFGGDAIERPIDSYWQLWYNSLGSWATSVPLICATGNHEYIKGVNKTLDERWVAQFNYPANGPKGYLSRSYYIDFSLMRFVIIDSNDLMWPWDVQRVRSWLAKTLRSTSQPWRIVMFHHPIYSVREGRLNPVMRYGFRSILEEQGVDLVLQGHDHAYSRTAVKTDAADTIPPVYIVSSASPKMYLNGFSDAHDRIGSGLYLYQVIDISPDTLHYRSFEFDDTLYDDIQIIRSQENGSKRFVDRARSLPELLKFNAFGNDKKGREKAERYRREAEERLLRRKALI